MQRMLQLAVLAQDAWYGDAYAGLLQPSQQCRAASGAKADVRVQNEHCV